MPNFLGSAFTQTDNFGYLFYGYNPSKSTFDYIELEETISTLRFASKVPEYLKSGSESCEHPIAGTLGYSHSSKWSAKLAGIGITYAKFCALTRALTRSGIASAEVNVLSSKDANFKEVLPSKKVKKLLKDFQEKLIVSEYSGRMPKSHRIINFIRAIRRDSYFYIVLENLDGTWPQFEHLKFQGSVIWLGKNHEPFWLVKGKWSKVSDFLYSYPKPIFSLHSIEDHRAKCLGTDYINSFLGYLSSLACSQ